MDWDKYGHCVKCHKNMLIEQSIDGKVQQRFTTDYSETEYLLDDGSKMRVAICVDCKKELTDKDIPKIMDCVKKGWEVEVKELKHWSEERKKSYLNTYLKKEIVTHSENIPDDTLELKLKEYKGRE
jgi:uncharacterized CHY-type Zn-finger protein